MKETTNSNKLSLHDQLLEARQRQQEEQVVGMLRSHGKLWKMDVFSWYKPSMYELENTLSSFPSPICWFANENDVLRILKEEKYWMSNVKSICTYDKAGFSLPNEVLDGIDSVMGAASMEDALDLMKALSKGHGILLFTSSGENWNEAKQKFEAFLEEQRKK